MVSEYSLIKELETLKKGNISKKKIKKKTYYYLQYFINGKIHSEYIKKEDLENVKSQLKRRKEIETYLKNNKLKVSMSKRGKSLTGFLMMEDVKVAKFKDGVLEEIDESKAPLYIKRTKDLEGYLKSRNIDLDRVNARILLKVLGIQNKDQIISLYSHGATITDNYWFKPSGSKLKYKDISFSSDAYSELALSGKIPQLPSLGSPSPELTNIGSFEKCWRIINNEWWIYKSGSEDNIFSELFSYKIAELLDIPTAIYEYDNGYIRSKNFTNKYNFEPMFSLLDNNETYSNVFNCLYSINKDIARDYLKLICFDLVIYNVDRHNQNYGLLRDKHSGKIISLAPNFDNNLALLSYNKTLDQSPNKDAMISLFTKFIKENDIARELFKEIKFNDISISDLEKIYQSIPIKRNENLINNFILNRLEYIKSLQK